MDHFELNKEKQVRTIAENATKAKIRLEYKDKNNGLIIITMVKFLDKNIVEKSRYIQREFSKWEEQGG